MSSRVHRDEWTSAWFITWKAELFNKASIHLYLEVERRLFEAITMGLPPPITDVRTGEVRLRWSNDVVHLEVVCCAGFSYVSARYETRVYHEWDQHEAQDFLSADFVDLADDYRHGRKNDDFQST